MMCCPVCGSTTVFLVTGGNLGQIYQCKACKYRGSFILEIDPGDQVPPEETPPGGPDR
jgi:hypothetical protein